MSARWTHRSRNRVETEIGELELLSRRYDRLVESTMTINQIIHRTFYLSVVAAGILIGSLPQVSTLLSRVPLYLFGALLFIAMFGWNQTYLNSRETLIDQLDAVANRIEETEYDLKTLDAGNYFSTNDKYEEKKWESYKSLLLPAYYLCMTAILLVVLLVDVSVTLGVFDWPPV